MTKRFIYDGMYIRDLHNKIPSILTDNDEQIDKYLTELNNLHQEGEQLKQVNEKLRQQIENLEKDKLDHVTMRERYRDNLLMDPLKCIHLKEIDKVLTKDGVETSLYKCEKGHSICQESMFHPICEDYEIMIKSIRGGNNDKD